MSTYCVQDTVLSTFSKVVVLKSQKPSEVGIFYYPFVVDERNETQKR